MPHYSFFGSDQWTSELQWVSQFKGEVGNYAGRTVCTEWGGPMSPGSKNGVSYSSLDYGKPPTNYFEAYIRGMSNQLRAWNMGSFYWVGLEDNDWYSMTTRSGTGAGLVLSVPNQSGLAQLQNAWLEREHGRLRRQKRKRRNRRAWWNRRRAAAAVMPRAMANLSRCKHRWTPRRRKRRPGRCAKHRRNGTARDGWLGGGWQRRHRRNVAL
jgi:hypothetical protein